MRSAAAHSRAHTFLGPRVALDGGSRPTGAGREGELPREVEVTLELEEEVRRLEDEVRRSLSLLQPREVGCLKH